MNKATMIKELTAINSSTIPASEKQIAYLASLLIKHGEGAPSALDKASALRMINERAASQPIVNGYKLSTVQLRRVGDLIIKNLEA